MKPHKLKAIPFTVFLLKVHFYSEAIVYQLSRLIDSSGVSPYGPGWLALFIPSPPSVVPFLVEIRYVHESKWYFLMS